MDGPKDSGADGQLSMQQIRKRYKAEHAEFRNSLADNPSILKISRVVTLPQSVNMKDISGSDADTAAKVEVLYRNASW